MYNLILWPLVFIISITYFIFNITTFAFGPGFLQTFFGTILCFYSGQFFAYVTGLDEFIKDIMS